MGGWLEESWLGLGVEVREVHGTVLGVVREADMMAVKVCLSCWVIWMWPWRFVDSRPPAVTFSRGSLGCLQRR